MSHAIKFSPVGGRIRIGCRCVDETSAIAEVGDEGIGIDPELLPRVFEAFAQGEEDQIRKYGGLGLGLAIARTIVELHEGTIAAHSEGKNKGASFSVVLPLPAGAPTVPAEQRRGGSTREVSIHPLRILLVEDHADGAWAMSRLMKADGHDVQWAADVSAGLKLAEEQTFDLLISDLRLPDGSGLDLMRALRLRGFPLSGIALSGYGQDEDVIRSREAGFAAHLTKPVVPDELQAIIRSIGENHHYQRSDRP